MGEDEQLLLTRVSYHAVTRYIQRVLGQPPIARGDSGSLVCAQAHCCAIGLSIDEVRGLILTPGVTLGLRLGAASVRTGNFVAKLVPAPGNGGGRVVATIYDRLHRVTLRDLTRSERHQLANAAQRRNKRRPSASIHAPELVET